MQRLERVSSDLATASGRNVAAPAPSSADLEAAVAKVLAARGAAPAAASSAATPLSQEAAIAQLTAIGDDWDKLEALWPTIEKAGLEEAVLAHYSALAEAAPGDAKAQYEYGAKLLVGIQNKPPAQQAGLAMKADAAFDKTLKLDDKHWGARFMKATSLSFWPKITGKHAEAMQHFEVLVEQQEQGSPQPHYAETYLFLGNMHLDNGNSAKARAAYERGLRWYPDNDNLKRQLSTLKKDG
jgi:tetratricopeptide (TPR) repeat protein